MPRELELTELVDGGAVDGGERPVVVMMVVEVKPSRQGCGSFC
jgi:hypothetical protein